MFKKLNKLWLRSLQKVGRSQLKQAGKVLGAIRTGPGRGTHGTNTTHISKSTNITNITKGTKSIKVMPAGAAAAGSWSTGVHISNSVPVRRMRYRLFVPDSPQSASFAMPLIVMLHGCQQNAADFAAGTGMNRLAGAKGYAVLYPEQSPRTHPQRCWKWYDAATQHGGGDIEMIGALVAKIAGQHAIDRTRIYACGISAGAAMAHILALTHPELIAAVGLHSGPAFGVARSAVGAYGVMQHGSSNPMAPIEALLARNAGFPPLPAILVAGDDDDVVRPVNQLQLVRQFNRINGGKLVAQPVASKTFGRVSKAWPRKRAMHVRDFTDGAAVMVRSVNIEGLGHAWSGGDDAFSFNARGPGASQLMLAFFGRHRRGT